MKNFLYTYCKPVILSTLTLLFILFASNECMAQGNGDRHDRIQQLKIEFITEQLNISPAAAKDFWPVYNEYDNAKQILFRKYRQQFKSENLNMEDVEQRMEREKEFLDLREKYINRMAKYLTPVQLTDLKRAERQFKKLVLSRAKNR